MNFGNFIPYTLQFTTLSRYIPLLFFKHSVPLSTLFHLPFAILCLFCIHYVVLYYESVRLHKEKEALIKSSVWEKWRLSIALFWNLACLLESELGTHFPYSTEASYCIFIIWGIPPKSNAGSDNQFPHQTQVSYRLGTVLCLLSPFFPNDLKFFPFKARLHSASTGFSLPYNPHCPWLPYQHFLPLVDSSYLVLWHLSTYITSLIFCFHWSIHSMPFITPTVPWTVLCVLYIFIYSKTAFGQTKYPFISCITYMYDINHVQYGSICIPECIYVYIHRNVSFIKEKLRLFQAVLNLRCLSGYPQFLLGALLPYPLVY